MKKTPENKSLISPGALFNLMKIKIKQLPSYIYDKGNERLEA